MVTVVLKGVHKVSANGRTYYYAWRGGGPRLDGEPGSPEFMASHRAAHEARRKPDDGSLRSLVTLYRGGPFLDLAESTRRNWSPWLDRIAGHFDLRIAQFDRPDKIRPLIRRWRSAYADKPRSADYGMQVLSRVLAHGVDLGKLGQNACEGIGQLYHGSRAEIIWTDDDLRRLKEKSSPEVAYAVDLAAHTGLRLGDLVKASWTHIGDHAIIIKTGKSKGRREAVVPLYAALRALLKRIPRRATTILASSRERPWTKDGFGSSFNKAKIDAGMAEIDLHFNDLRGTAATKFYLAGIDMRAIAEIMAWEEESVERIIRRYVARDAAVKALIRQIDRAEKAKGGTPPVKTAVKP